MTQRMNVLPFKTGERKDSKGRGTCYKLLLIGERVQLAFLLWKGYHLKSTHLFSGLSQFYFNCQGPTHPHPHLRKGDFIAPWQNMCLESDACSVGLNLWHRRLKSSGGSEVKEELRHRRWRASCCQSQNSVLTLDRPIPQFLTQKMLNLFRSHMLVSDHI